MPLLKFVGKIVRRIVARDWGPQPWRIPVQALAKLLLLLMLLLGAVLALIAAVSLAPLLLALLLLFLGVMLFVWAVGLLESQLLRAGPPEPRPMPQGTPTPPPHTLVDPANTDAEYDAVFEGGGVKAIAHIGAVRRLEDAGMKPRHVAGTSGGAVIAAGLAAGGDANDLWQILTSGDLTRVMAARLVPNRPVLRRPLYALTPLIPGLLLRKSLLQRAALREFFRESLAGLVQQQRPDAPADPAFGDLPGASREVHLIAADITRRVTVDFPQDAAAYDGLTPETMPVADAVYMSSAIPFFFAPMRLRIAGTGVEADVVDGGVTSQFPVWAFDVAGTPRVPTFGFLLEERKRAPSPIRNVLSFAFNIIQTGIGSADDILFPQNNARTIRIPTMGVDSTNFDLSAAEQDALFLSGYEAADQFLREFDWPTYVREFRG